MTHKFDIWQKAKGNTGNGYISNHIEMSESELEEFALELFKRQYSVDDYMEYEARLGETII